MSVLVIRDARLVNEDRITESDVLIRGGRIEQIGSGIAIPDGADVVDAGGRYLLPGMIDDQVHFREPGLTAKGDLATESAAAVAGGITSFMDMPNVRPATVTREALAAKYALAKGRVSANYAFYFGATNDNIAEIEALQTGECCGVKAFMGASTGNLLVDDPDALELLFERCPVLIATHCEDSPIIWRNEELWRERFGDDVPMSEHPAIRSREACLKSSTFAVDLATRHGSRLHVLHITTADELSLFSDGDRNDKRITAEACVHHLWFDDSRYVELGTRIKCNPAIKAEADREALLDAVASGRIDIVATDHAPHTSEEKSSLYFDAPAGLPLVQHALLSMLEHHARGRLTLEQIVQRVCHAPADVFGVVDRGYIREGFWADLVLVDLDGSTTVTPESVLYKCAWSPFEGVTFGSSIDMTIVNGVIAWRDGAMTGSGRGQRLEFSPRP